MGEINSHLMGKLAANDQINRFMFLKNNDSRGLCVYDHNFQTSLKPIGQSKPNSMWSLHGKGGHKLIKMSSDMTKTAAMPIYGKNH